MPQREWSRRDVLRQCLAAGVLVVPAGWEKRRRCTRGSKRRASGSRPPMSRWARSTRSAPPRPRCCGPQGIPACRSPSADASSTIHGEPVPGATIEVWQANHGGLYDLEGYRYRAAITPPPSGAYTFESIMPGHYPARVARHVHYFVTAPGHKPLSTQLYFATDEVFDGNPDKNFTKDPLITSRTLCGRHPHRATGRPAGGGGIRTGAREGRPMTRTRRSCRPAWPRDVSSRLRTDKRRSGPSRPPPRSHCRPTSRA